MNGHRHPDSPTTSTAVPRSMFRAAALLLLAVYGAGLTQSIARPWVGLHDWNGAFYSQLARNLLRHPLSVTRGFSLDAPGPAPPPREAWAVYAHHPPGLVWLTAAAFAPLGDAAWAARIPPILASLVSLWLLVDIVRRRLGERTAILAGLIYALLPMSVYFGRMLNHEPVCLALMLAVVAARDRAREAGPSGRRWVLASCGLIVATVWVDWVGGLFAVLLAASVLGRRTRQALGASGVGLLLGASAMGAASVTVFIVQAGFDGRWADLWMLATSRREALHASLGDAWPHVVANLSWPVIVAGSAGLLIQCIRLARTVFRRSAAGAEAYTGMAVVTATGLIWVILFWRQFLIHQYWMFYLGPAAAVMAAIALARADDALRPRWPRAALAGAVGALAVLGAFCVQGSNDYFGRRPFSEQLVRDLRELARLTGLNEGVLLHWDPFRSEQVGDHVSRHVAPPQLAYYLDRRIGACDDPAGVPELSAHYSYYVMPFEDPRRSAFTSAQGLPFQTYRVGPFAVVDLRNQSAVETRPAM